MLEVSQVIQSPFAYVSESDGIIRIKLSSKKESFAPAFGEELENATIQIFNNATLRIEGSCVEYVCIIDSLSYRAIEYKVEEANDFDPPLEIKERSAPVALALSKFKSLITGKEVPVAVVEKYAVSKNSFWHRKAKRTPFALTTSTWKVTENPQLQETLTCDKVQTA